MAEVVANSEADTRQLASEAVVAMNGWLKVREKLNELSISQLTEVFGGVADIRDGKVDTSIEVAGVNQAAHEVLVGEMRSLFESADVNPAIGYRAFLQVSAATRSAKLA